MANFGSILKNLRTSRGITQGELATMLDVSRSTVGMYETGGREPDFETMEAIADIFNVDMDYLMVSMDIKTGIFADLRPENKRIAHVNPYHHRFDPLDVEPGFWYRQFDRCPKGYSRGIDTRPVARQYKAWIEYTLEMGDRSLHSKTREYANRAMNEAIAPVIAAGFTKEQASALYHMFKGESNTWEASKIKHEVMLQRITTWLESVEDDAI